MKQKSFMDRMSLDKKRTIEKEQIVSKIKKNYSRFGDRIVNIMINYACTEGGLTQLARRLEIPRSEIREDNLHPNIINWLNTFGERRFIELHSPNEKKKHNIFAIHPVIKGNPQKPLYSLEAESSPKKEATGGPTIEELPPPQKKKHVHIEGVYSGLDRRSGRDRRDSPDRRMSVELIFKNRRYGGERRSGEDRRKNGDKQS